MNLNDFVLDHTNRDWNSLLTEWKWLIVPPFEIVLMSQFGDLFICADNGIVKMLDVGAGSLETIASTQKEFFEKLHDLENATNWLMIPLVQKLASQNIRLNEEHCYSFKVPPVLGGKYELENVAVLPIHELYGAYGSIRSQIKDLPYGSEVIFKVK